MNTLSTPNPVRQIVISHLLKMKSKVLIASLSLVGIILTEVLTPWPLKIIFDYILLNKPLPDFLGYLDPVLQSGTWEALVILSCSIAGIALLNGSFSYFQTYMTARVGHELVYSYGVNSFTSATIASFLPHSIQNRGITLPGIR